MPPQAGSRWWSSRRPPDAVREAFAGQAGFALQAEPRGTADALRAALEALPEDAAEILVLSGDVPLVDPDLLVELAAARRDTDAAMALVTVDMEDPASPRPRRAGRSGPHQSRRGGQ